MIAVPPDAANIDILAILLSGYPSSDQLYEIHENNHLGLARRNVVCRPHSQPSDESLLEVQAERPLDKHPDGMSGGPAFVIQLESGRPRAYFAGMIVRGGKETFRILKSGVIVSFLESVFS